MWHRVGLVITDVSEERVVSVFVVEESTWVSPLLALFVARGEKCRLLQDPHGIFHVVIRIKIIKGSYVGETYPS
jgi:hypothetical protein